MLLTLAMLVPTFGALPAAAADGGSDASADDETQFVAALYDADGKFLKNYDSVSMAMVYACENTGNRKVKLLADSVEDTPISVIGGTHATLDLNGYTLRRKNENNMSDKIGYVIDVGERGTLTIDDSSEAKTGTIRGGGAKYGGGIYAEKDSVVTMNAGTIFKCSGYYGGGVYLCDNAQFIMNGGKINKCYGHYGGGVYVEDNAVFTTNGGEISNCIAEADGGGVYIWNAKAEISNCYIAKNSAKNGGGIYSGYSMSDEYSILKINHSSVVNNKATGNYGGVYAKGYLVLQSYTTISGNVNYGEYGGGVYSQNDSIEISGSVYVFGNRTCVSRQSDVSFGKVLNQAFKFGGEKTEYGLIGVRTDYNVPKTWYYDDHRSYGGCTKGEHVDEMRAFASCLFSNSGNVGFKEDVVQESEDESTTSFNKRHFVKLVSQGIEYDSNKVGVKEVRYKGIVLPESEYDVYYSTESRTIQLNVPDYLTETWDLTVLTDNGVSFYNGTKVAQNGDGARYGLLVNNTEKSKLYTISVENGRINGAEPDESGTSTAQKKFFDSLEIEPIVQNDKVFSHWELEGDYTIDGISGFKKYAKKLKNVLMPNGNIRLKPVFKDKVKTVEVRMYSPTVGARTPFYTSNLDDKWLKADVVYKAPNGETLHSEKINVTWKKQQEMFDGTAIHYFDYYANYLADFQVQDSLDANFRLADRGELELNLYMDGEFVDRKGGAYPLGYQYVYGDGYDPWNSNNDYQPIIQRIFKVTRYYTSEKAPIRKSIPSQISVPENTTKQQLTELLPESVNVQIADISYSNGKEMPEITHSPVDWNTDDLPDTVTGRFEINGTYNTAKEGFELKGNENIYPTLIVVPDTQELSEMPQVIVDGTPVTVIGDTAKIAINKKIKLTTSMENADIHYRLDGGELTTYGKEIELSGKKDAVTAHEIEAYAEADGKRSETLKMTIEVDNKTTYTVDITDPNNKEYLYCEGIGEYKLGETVSVDLHQKWMDNPWTPSPEFEHTYDPHKRALTWSAKGLVLNDTQKENPIFTFDMPNSNVVIKLETFKYLDTTHSVTIVDQDGNPYEYAMGAGEYKEGEKVTIDSTQFKLKSVSSEGVEKIEETATKAESVVSQWSAEGITLTDAQKKASKFEFTMPYNDVTIKAEDFRPLVKRVYLSSIIPVAGKPLPDKLEILSATDANGNEIDKENIWLETTLPEDGMWADIDTGETFNPGTIAEVGRTYRTFFGIQSSVSGETAVTCDDYEVFMDGEKISDSRVIFVATTAAKDELLSVDWGENRDLFYSMDDAKASLTSEVKVKTKYGLIDTAKVTWNGAEKLDSNLAYRDFPITATLTLPDYVADPNGVGTKQFTIKVRKHIDSVVLATTSKDIKLPARQGDRFPTKNDLQISNQGADVETVIDNVKVLNNEGSNVIGYKAQAGEEYTITVSIVPNTDYAVLSEDTVFTINGNVMQIAEKTENPTENRSEVYKASYTFVAQKLNSYLLCVNGKKMGSHENGSVIEYTPAEAYRIGFDHWTAEAVYDTTENVYDSEGKVIGTTTVTHRSPVNPFKDGAEYNPVAKFVMPLLVDDNARLELTANYAHGITSYDRDTKNANIVSDKAYDGIKVIFAAYDKSDKLVSVSLADTDLAKGENTVTAPEDFVVKDGEILKIMVWNNMEDMIPLFGAFEQTYEKKTEGTDESGTTDGTDGTESVQSEE